MILSPKKGKCQGEIRKFLEKIIESEKKSRRKGEMPARNDKTSPLRTRTMFSATQRRASLPKKHGDIID